MYLKNIFFMPNVCNISILPFLLTNVVLFCINRVAVVGLKKQFLIRKGYMTKIIKTAD